MFDQEASFRAPSHDRVGVLARAGTKWAVILTLLRQIVTIGTTMVVSRYVSPEDFGIAGMVLSFAAFLVLFDTGLTWATVQSPALNKEKVDSLFAFGVFLGLFLWLGAALSGPVLARFYGQPGLSPVASAMGGAIFLNSLTTQPAALLKRQLRQRTTNGIDTAALLVSSVVAVVMALAGYGYWTVIIQAIALQTSRTALLFGYSGYRPAWPANFQVAFPELKVGAGLALSNYICYFQLYLGGILVGRFFGGALLGNYQKAYGVKSMPTAYGTMVITDVMVSSLAALHSDKERMGQAYLKALRLIAFVGCPAGAALYPLSSEVIRLLYGQQWAGAVPMLEWFALAATALPISTTTIWLFLASGQVRQQLRMNVFLSALAIICLIAAARFGNSVIDIVATESVLFAGPYLLVNIVMSHRAVGLPLLPTLRIVAPIIFGSLFGVGLATWIGHQFMGIDWRLMFIAKALAGGVGYLTICALFMDRLPINIRPLRHLFNNLLRVQK